MGFGEVIIYGVHGVFFFSFDGDLEVEGVPKVAGGDGPAGAFVGDFDGDTVEGVSSATLISPVKKSPLCENPL